MKNVINTLLMIVFVNISFAQNNNFDDLIKTNPKDCKLYFNAAIEKFRNNNNSEAIKYFAKAYSVKNIDITLVDKYYGQYLFEISNYEEAILKYNSALKNEKNFSITDYNNLAISYLKTNDLNAALVNVKKALLKNENDLNSLMTLATIYDSKSDWNNLNKVANQIVLLDKNNIFAQKYKSISENEILSSGKNLITMRK